MYKAWGVTHFSDVVDFSYEWKIVNPGRCLKIHQKIESPPLTIPGTDGLVCRLVCTGYFPGGIVSKIQVHQVEKVVGEATLFYIQLECENGGEVKLAGAVDVLCDDIWLRGKFGDQANEVFATKQNLANTKYGWNFVPVQPTSYFTSNTNRFQNYNGFWHTLQIVNDSWQTPNQPLQIKLSLFSPGDMIQTSSLVSPTVMTDTSGVVLDLKSLMLDTKHSDVVLKCKGEKFHCHKAILGARSAVFSRMFDADMKEATSGLVEIDDVEPDIIEAMVEYIYTGEATKQVEDLPQLVYVGDKYELKGLVEFCFQKFNLHQDDDKLVMEMLFLADKHSLNKFKDLAMKKILMDKAKFISDKDFMSRIEKNPQILVEFFKV